MANKSKRGKVLIVAGSAESLMHYQTQLSQYQTETALTAETAIDRIDDFEPDVLVIDDKLPSIPGTELVQWVRSDQASPHYYAIMLVVQNKAADTDALLLDSGADTVCRSDLIKQDLAQRVALLFKLKDSQDRARALILKLSQSKEVIRELEDQDSVTRLYNLTYINMRLEKEFRHSERFDLPLAVMIMVIDEFREISHIKGALFCIKLLQQLGNELIHLTRADDVVGRSWGGEFVMILPETKPEGVQFLQDRIIAYVNQHLYGLEHDRIPIDLSFGVASYLPGQGQKLTIQQLLLDAENDLSAQQASKNAKPKKLAR